MPTLQDKFRGCLLGAMIGDVAGAVVEAESPGYIAKSYRSVGEILATDSVEEFAGPAWRVGRFTDDTQMMLCVAQWMVEDEPPRAEKLLARFADAYEPWRRYGPGTAGILRMYSANREQWRELSTAMFPHGSHGNGSATRVAPVGLAYHRDLKKLSELAIESSRPTHSHPLAYQGAATRVAPADFLGRMRSGLRQFDDLLQDTSKFATALDAIESGLARDASCLEMSNVLGTGISAWEAVPMALYCFLRHADSFERVIHEAVFIGGDTDTIACMAGAIAGAFHGADAIPKGWLAAVREDRHSVQSIERLADQLVREYGAGLLSPGGRSRE